MVYHNVTNNTQPPMRLQFKLLPLIWFIPIATANQWRLCFLTSAGGAQVAALRRWARQQLPFHFTPPAAQQITRDGFRSASPERPFPPFKPIRFSISAKFRRHWHTHTHTLLSSRSLSKRHWRPLLCSNLSNRFQWLKWCITVTYSWFTLTWS